MKVVITGISSFLASELVPIIESDKEITEILGLDIIEPKYTSQKIKFIKKDIRDKRIFEDLRGYDAIIHLAFIVSPISNRREMYSINLDGSKNVFNCAIKAGIKKIIHASSVAAYGAFPENPIPITEEHPIRLMKKHFYYNETKYYVEKYLDELSKKYPDVIITRIRPSIFLGPNINNFFRTYFLGNKIYTFSPDVLVQLAWIDDVAEVFYLVLKKDVSGAFNIGADNPISSREIAEKLGINCVKLPYHFGLLLINALYKLRILKSLTPGWIRATRYPIIVDSSKAKQVLGWTPKYDTYGSVKALYDALKESGEI